MRKRNYQALWVCFLGLATAARVGAQDTFKYTGCSDVTKANFNKVSLVDLTKDPSLSEPIRFAVSNNGSVYFAERGGSVKVIKPTGAIVKLGTIATFRTTQPLAPGQNNELGLTGLTLDPNFDTNHWIYTLYEPTSPDVMKLSRFTLNGDVLDLTSEKVIFTLPYQKDYCCHTGGGMQFDAKGDLWFSTGNNTKNPPTAGAATDYIDENNFNGEGDDQGHAANTNDYRGKIIRIHPLADATYTIPAGNFKDVYGSMWSAADLAKVKPEIYTMGHRNAYTISVDSQQGLLAWGDVGPDDQWDTEELDITDKPGFMGWPYFAGAVGNPHYVYRGNKDPAAPLNTSKNNTGVQKLPAAIGATIGYHESCAITGPVYRYSAAQTSAKKVPPHFENKWFTAEFTQGWIHVNTMDASGTKVLSTASLVTGLVRPLEVTIGPDGILYVLEYANGYFMTDGSTRISRYEYVGPACASTSIAKAPEASKGAANTGMLLNLGMDARRMVAVPADARGFQVYDLKGKMVWENTTAKGLENVAAPAALGNGVYRVKYLF